MLNSLYIENIAVIETASIDFRDGFTVMTGETGAGKSIIIDAINMALGERTSRDSLRAGAEAGRVSAMFELPEDALASSFLQRADFAFDGTVLLERTLTSEGRSFGKVNGRPVSTAFMRELGNLMLNIHGQHDSQYLLQSERHIEYLDAFAGLTQDRGNYALSYGHLRALEKEYAELEADEQQKIRELELLHYQADEIEGAALQADEEGNLLAKRQIIQNMQRLTESLAAVRESLAPEEGEGALSMMHGAVRHLSGVASLSPDLESLHRTLNDLYYQLEDVRGEVYRLFEDMAYDDAEIEAVESRLALIGRLKQKYGATIGEVLDYATDARRRIDGILISKERKKTIAQELENVYNNLRECAQKLTANRTKAASVVSVAVERELSALSMQNTRFVVSITPHQAGVLSEYGAESVAFLLATNPGEPPKPLARVVSGGELSRIMLALKSVLGRADGVDTMVFD